MYKNGYYVEKDELEAFRIYEHCLDGLNGTNTPILGADVHIRVADCYHFGVGTEVDLPLALEHYQTAEQQYWRRLRDGDFLIKNQYVRSIEMQQRVREQMKGALPEFDWTGRKSD